MYAQYMNQYMQQYLQAASGQYPMTGVQPWSFGTEVQVNKMEKNIAYNTLGLLTN